MNPVYFVEVLERGHWVAASIFGFTSYEQALRSAARRFHVQTRISIEWR